MDRKNFENSNISIPDYIAQEMKNDITNKKIYGKSVLDYIPSNEDYDDTAFTEDLLSESEIDEERKFLKNNNNGAVSELIKTDAITGVKNSIAYGSDRDYERLIDMLDNTDIRGKKITNSGKAMIKDLIKSDPTEEEISTMSKAFENIRTNNIVPSISDIESILGDRISNKIKQITNSTDYESVLKRFFDQLYNTYSGIVEYNDDVRDLTKLIKKVDDLSSDSDNDQNFKNLIDIQDSISKFMNNIKHLDDRNSRLKQDYSLDDYDIRMIDSAAKCLDSALSFELIYQKIDNSKNKFKKDIKNIDYVNNTIDNWIQDIREDPDTLYTLPVNDYLPLNESRESLVNYLYMSLLLDIAYNSSYFKGIPVDENDLEKWLINDKILNDEIIRNYKLRARLTLFVISRTFKYKKLSSEDNRRILSYTLDMISKLNVSEYREKFVKLTNYISKELIS